MSTTTEALRRRLDQLQGRYSFVYAGKPRVTRPLGELDDIIRTGEALLTEATGTAGATEVVSEIKERLDLWGAERSAIVAAQAEGPGAYEAAVLGTRANFVFGLYRRHFANQSRASRDPKLLEEMIEMLDEIATDMAQLATEYTSDTLSNDYDTVQNNIETYNGELTAIRSAKVAGDIAEQASLLAGDANTQFTLYRTHFANRSRLSRRIGLLERIISALEDIQTKMRAISAEGFSEEFHTKNLDIVGQKLDHYRKEADAIRDARAGTNMDQLVGTLGQEANSIFEEYNKNFAGQNRATRDLDMMTAICDRLFEVERQMWDLSRAVEHESNLRNLRIVHDSLMVYDREWGAIKEAVQ